MSHNFYIVIPARFNSSRLPGKPLLPLAGKSLIQRTYENALNCNAKETIIATDDLRIAEACHAFGAKVCMTKNTHLTGTDRIAEVVEINQWPDDAIIVNVQGDEPFMPVSTIHTIYKALETHQNAAMATACCPIQTIEDIFNPNCVKVVLDSQGLALYFSRAPIPWDRDTFATPHKILAVNTLHYRHIGLYAYRAQLLRQYASWAPSILENIEALEQLRILHYGARIHVSILENPLPPGIDTAEDIQVAEKILLDI